MDDIHFASIAQRVSARLNRRSSLGFLAAAGLPLAGVADEAQAGRKKAKKVTLCFNGQTVKKPKKKAKKLRKQGASKGACPATTQPPRCGAGGPCTVFVTSAGFTGSEIGGLDGADAKCTALANTAGKAGAFKAWLSAGDQVPATRFGNIDRAGPWLLARNASDGANPPPTVAADFSDLTTCPSDICLQHAIDRDQNGVTPVSLLAVWTGTFADGSAAGLDCTGWTSNDGQGRSGLFGAVDAKWTDSSVAPLCDSGFRLYCFQQAS